jgi:MoxR-like ATPase
MQLDLKFIPKHFNPATAGGTVDQENQTVTFRAPDGSVHVYDDEIILAVNVALTVGRPLFVSGEPGSGKTTLASSVAAVVGWRYYKSVITSRTQARDLEWSFDTLRRLGDAQVGKDELKPRGFYVDPGVLWWAFSPDTAALRGMRQTELPVEMHLLDPARVGSKEGAVVLLDEIDKADPDVPNNLLEPLDVQQFKVEETQFPVSQDTRKVLVIITTNGERELPPAFLRRCVSLELKPPTEPWLKKIAGEKFPDGDRNLHARIAVDVMQLRLQAKSLGLREPSTAEFLDAIEVCRDLGIGCDSPVWQKAARAVLWKHEAQLQLGGA